MKLEESLAIAGALADRSRLRILGALLTGPKCVEELAGGLDLASSTVSFHLRKLRLAGLVVARREQYYAIYALATDRLHLTVKDLMDVDETQAPRRGEHAADGRGRVLAAFFRGGRLLRMPVQKRKRTIVLEEFAAQFAPGRRYAERGVDEIISAMHDDHCLVRRLLVDEGYLRRDGGVYERSSKPLGRQETSTGRGEAGEMEIDPDTRIDSRARRAQIRRAYKERERQPGVFRVVNTATGRMLLGSGLDLHAPLNRVTFELDMAMCWNADMKSDLETYGRDSFVIEVVEKVELRDDPDFDPERELELLEHKHLALLDWSTAYNKDERIRYP
jgi:DNA-binding transcriptional ArsR family regulator